MVVFVGDVMVSGFGSVLQWGVLLMSLLLHGLNRPRFGRSAEAIPPLLETT